MSRAHYFSERGFTLIELMVVIAVLGILSTIAMTNLAGAQSSARDAERKVDLSSYRLALERYYSTNASYPLGDFGNDNTDVSGLTPTGIFSPGSPLLTSGFIGDLVRDPSTQANATLYYRYRTDNQGFKYVLYAKLEAGLSTWWVEHYDGTAEGTSVEPTNP